VLVKIEAAGICATDLHLVRRSTPYLQPNVEVCGHEEIGRIMSLGPKDDDLQWKIGCRATHRWLY
jgi:propanol-preferring alcohol dehydrogenase